jgi:hypothetical protein
VEAVNQASDEPMRVLRRLSLLALELVVVAHELPVGQTVELVVLVVVLLILMVVQV